jgi:hypothetical protein
MLDYDNALLVLEFGFGGLFDASSGVWNLEVCERAVLNLMFSLLGIH